MRRVTRASEVVAKLRALAEQAGPDTKLPTVRDLCHMLQVSPMTLDVALAEMEERELIYRRHAVGIFVSPKIKQKEIHVVLNPNLFQSPGASPVWGRIWACLMEQAETRSQQNNESYTFHFSNTLEAPGPIREFFMSQLEEQRVHAILGIGLPMSIFEIILDFGVPIIGFAGNGNHHVVTDNREAVEQTVDLLIERGCRSIGYWRQGPYSPDPGFSLVDVPDPARLVRRFRDCDDPIAAYLRTFAPRDTSDRLDAYVDGDPVSDDFLRDVVDILNVALWAPELYNAPVFRDMSVRPANRERTWDLSGHRARLWTHRDLIQAGLQNDVSQEPASQSQSIAVFRKRLQERGLPDGLDMVQAGLVDPLDPERVQFQDQGYEMAMRVFQDGRGPRPDGIIIEDDMIASGVHAALDKLGIAIGRDVQIATHSNAGTPTLYGLRDRIIRMEYDPQDFVRGMLHLMDHERRHDIDHMLTERVKPTLICPT